MISPPFPEDEFQRQQAVEKYRLLDTLPEESYDNITALMAHVCDTPISLITLLDRDRNFLKSHHGVPFNESPRNISFCGHAINSDDVITIVEDARIDERFHDNPLVAEHNAIFYAGVPLVDPEGYKLGTLCVYDVEPRQLNEAQISALLAMAKQVMRLFEERYQNYKLQQLQQKLEQRNENLERFAGIVSHDLKSPLAQITSLTQLLEEDLGDSLNSDTLQYLEYIKVSSDSLRGYIDGILRFYRADDLAKKENEWVEVTPLMKELQSMFKGNQSATIQLSSKLDQILVNRAALMQVMVNLISNAIKYNDKNKPVIDVTMNEDAESYRFTVADNGPGIREDELPTIFELFTASRQADRYGNIGSGIGLATVRKVVTALGGTIEVHSVLGEGTSFSFDLKK